MSEKETSSVKTVQKQPVRMDPRQIYKLTGTLTAICVVVSLLLALVNQITEPVITQRQDEKKAAAMAQDL